MSQVAFSRNKLTFSHIVKARFFWVFAAMLLFATVGAVAFVANSGAAADAEDVVKKEVMPVKVVVARFVNSVVYKREFSGVVRAKRSSDLSFERSAEVIEINFDDGESVSKGEVIARLDSVDLANSKARINAEIKNAQAVLDELKQGPRREVIDSAQAEVNALKAELQLAQNNNKRRDGLRQTEAISMDELDRSEFEVKAKGARLKSAEAKLAELTNGTREEKVRAQQAMVEQLNAQLAQVDRDIKKSSLRAAYTGQIAARFVDEGVFTTPGAPIVRLTETSQLEAAIGLPPALLSSLSEGQRFEFQFDDKIYWATLARILPEIDNITRTVPVIFKLDACPLKPGQIIRIVIEEERDRKGIWVPTESLLPAAKGTWSVFVIDESGKVPITKAQSVKVIFTEGERSLISGTVNSGDKIVCEGAQRLSQGQAVRIVD